MEELFESDERMFVPLTVDDMEVSDTNYFLSGTKLLIAAVGLIPWVSTFFYLKIFPSLWSFIIFTIVYILIYTVYLRFAVFEEVKQRKQMKELENNKISNVSYFWEWDKIGKDQRDDGLIYIQSNGISLRRAYIVGIDYGSMIGVPSSYYRLFRQTEQDFLREAYRSNMDIKVYDIRKPPETSKALIAYSDMLRHLDKEKQQALIELSKLNIDINMLYGLTTDQRYVRYYLVITRNLETIRNFRSILNDMVKKTFGSNSTFNNPHILGKAEVDDFLANFFGLEAVNTEGIHKTDGYQNLSKYVDLLEVYDQDGKLVPIHLFDEIITPYLSNDTFSSDLDDMIAKGQEEEEKWEQRRLRSYEKKEKELQRERRLDNITHDEYLKRLDQLKEDHLPENFNEIVEMDEKARDAYFKEQERKELKEQKRDRIRKEKVKKKENKWYELKDLGLDADVELVDPEEIEVELEEEKTGFFSRFKQKEKPKKERQTKKERKPKQERNPKKQPKIKVIKEYDEYDLIEIEGKRAKRKKKPKVNQEIPNETNLTEKTKQDGDITLEDLLK